MRLYGWGRLIGLAVLTAGFIGARALETPTGVPVSIGTSYSIKSSSLGEDREVLVALPEGYETGADEYPVVYLPEGQWYFPFAADMMKRLASRDQMPPSILVAMKMENPKRFGLLQPGGEGSQKLAAFLREELIPFVEGNFRTNAHRTLMGWEYGGAFSLYVLAQQPDLFDAYIASSPFPIGEHNNDFSKVSAADPKFLFFGVSQNESVVNGGVEALEKKLQNEAIEGLSWQSHLAAGGDLIANHVTSPYPLFLAGLSHLHAPYRPLKPQTSAEFHEMGGVEFAKKHYARRAEIYGTPEGIAPQSIWWLLRIAAEGNDFPLFEEILNSVEIFSERFRVFFENEHRYVGYAGYLLENGKHGDAVAMLQKTVGFYPQSVRASFRLAKTYETVGNSDAATAEFKRAIKLAEEQSHAQTALIKEQFEAFKNAADQ